MSQMPYDNDKPEVFEYENEKDTGTPARHTDSSAASDSDLAENNGVNEKAVVRKLDWHIVPWLSFLYLLSFLDRTNIGNAK